MNRITWRAKTLLHYTNSQSNKSSSTIFYWYIYTYIISDVKVEASPTMLGSSNKHIAYL
jgi:hypothetical protein